jgi:hypothetical protein
VLPHAIAHRYACVKSRRRQQCCLTPAYLCAAPSTPEPVFHRHSCVQPHRHQHRAVSHWHTCVYVQPSRYRRQLCAVHVSYWHSGVKPHRHHSAVLCSTGILVCSLVCREKLCAAPSTHTCVQPHRRQPVLSHNGILCATPSTSPACVCAAPLTQAPCVNLCAAPRTSAPSCVTPAYVCAAPSTSAVSHDIPAFSVQPHPHQHRGVSNRHQAPSIPLQPAMRVVIQQIRPGPRRRNVNHFSVFRF